MELPIEYKKGYTEFLGCKIDLRYRPLIPRIETAEWVKLAIKEMDNLSHVGKIVRCLDMFAGSGCVGVAVLAHFKKFPNVLVDFVDISPKCLKQIEINCELNGITRERYRLFCSDVFSKRSQPCSSRLWVVTTAARRPGCFADFGSYDFILANPPYCLKENVDTSVLSFEPKQAVLGGGKDGLRLVRKFLREANKYIRRNPAGILGSGPEDDNTNGGWDDRFKGKIFMEFDDFQKPLIEEWLKKSTYKKWKFEKDQFGSDRLLIIDN